MLIPLSSKSAPGRYLCQTGRCMGTRHHRVCRSPPGAENYNASHKRQNKTQEKISKLFTRLKMPLFSMSMFANLCDWKPGSLYIYIHYPQNVFTFCHFTTKNINVKQSILELWHWEKIDTHFNKYKFVLKYFTQKWSIKTILNECLDFDWS